MNTYEQNAHTYTGPGPCTVLIPNEEGELEACGWTSASNPIHQPMTWAVGNDLGLFCGEGGCRNTPAQYSQMCVKHLDLVR